MNLVIGGLKIEKESPKDTNYDNSETAIKTASKRRDIVTCLLDRMKEREEDLMTGSAPGTVNLETMRNVLLD
ncbi:hypothetical protein QMP26_19290 [Enterocloster clostridioformis]|uniref:hypothetical protein n=1 Tax=Enterocloster clostridioformis TaxID=1531 RepID=UPI0026746DC2|nr:hypothetical protein [Enterocloster clostridioformis]